MRTFIFFVLFLLFAGNTFSQDTLFTKDGKIINGKILEVRASQIKYKSETDVGKQFSLIETSKLVSIHYKNGTQDLFETMADSSSFRTTVIDGRSIPNQPVDDAIQQQNLEKEYARKAEIADNFVVGLRVVGFILRIALEVAVGGSHCNTNHGSYHPRGH